MAPIISPDELRSVAEQAVDEIVERKNQSGGLKVWNNRFKAHRRQQLEKAAPALPYHAFIERFVTTPTVRNIAMMGRVI